MGQNLLRRHMFFTIATLLYFFTLTVGDTSISDVSGTYRLLKGRYSYKKLEIYGNGSVIGEQDILFDGRAECEGVLNPELVSPASAAEKQKYGTYVQETQTSMECNNNHGFIKTFRVIRPKIDTTETVYLALLSPVEVELKAGSKYAFFWAEYGSSMYVEMKTAPTSSASQNPPTTNSNNGQTATEPTSTGSTPTSDNAEKKGGENQDIWKWLGPVLGAIATVVGAVITVRCVKSRKDAPASGS